MLIKMKCPTVVHSYEIFDGGKTFVPIKLLGAIRNPETYSPAKHGFVSTAIQYFIPYSNDTVNQLLLSVALGTIISMNTILVNTVITEWRLSLYLQ